MRAARALRGRTAAVLLALLLLGTAAPAQEVAPAPYEPAEFPQWARDLRRAEIVALGSFPITLLATRLVYGLGRFVVKSIQAGQIDARYAPWFFAAPGAPSPQRVEQIAVLSVSFSLSATVALVDYLLGRSEREAEQPNENRKR